MTADIRELRPLTALRLLTIRRETRDSARDPLEQAALCNARVLAEACFSDGHPVFSDGGAVLEALTFPEMETLLDALARQGRAAPRAAGQNPGFDSGRFESLQRGER